MTHVFIAALLGFLMALIVNRLADYLPARRYCELARRNPFSTVQSSLPTPSLLPHTPLQHWFGVTSLLSGGISRRAVRYFTVEIVLSLSFALIAYFYGLSLPVGFFYVYAALFTLIAVIDVEHRWVLPSTLIALAICGVLEWLLFGWRHALQEMPRGALHGFALGLCLWLLGTGYARLKKAVRGKAIGRTIFGSGDIWLLSACGMLIGGEYILFALLITMLSGGIAAIGVVIWSLFKRDKRRRNPLAIPYAPHILIGTAVWLYAPAAATAVLRSLVLG
ncbi:MAG: prepilin peptidase [Anaerolineae bacterium]|nr:prepilin peptidase [Anaerolineae bacterium]